MTKATVWEGCQSLDSCRTNPWRIKSTANHAIQPAAISARGAHGLFSLSLPLSPGWPLLLDSIWTIMTKERAHATEAESPYEDNVSDSQDIGSAVQLAEQAEEQRLSPWTPRMFRLYFVLCIAYLCGCLVRFQSQPSRLNIN